MDGQWSVGWRRGEEWGPNFLLQGSVLPEWAMTLPAVEKYSLAGIVQKNHHLALAWSFAPRTCTSDNPLLPEPLSESPGGRQSHARGSGPGGSHISPGPAFSQLYTKDQATQA